MKLILGFTGEKAGGKGTAAAYMRERYGASSYRYSDFLRTILGVLGLSVSREHLITLSVSLRRDFGEDVLARAIAAAAEKDPHEIVVVEGIRRVADCENLRALPNFHLIHLTAEVKIRYERSKARGENAGDQEMAFEQFLKEELAPTEISIRDTAALAETKIENNGTKEELYKKIDDLVKSYAP